MTMKNWQAIGAARDDLTDYVVHLQAAPAALAER
jgi:hypothetical protein